MTPLRQRMLQDMQLRGLAPKTQAAYAHRYAPIGRLLQQIPDQISEEELRD